MANVASERVESELAAAVLAANVPTLLMVLVQLTGDERWLGERYRPTRPVGTDDNDSGGLPEDMQVEIRNAAASAMSHARSGEAPAVALPDPETLLR